MIKPIGILGLSPGWERVLEQERVNYEVIANFNDLNRFGVIILNQPLRGQAVLAIQNYLALGGAILADFTKLKSVLKDFRYQTSRVRYIIPNEACSVFDNVQLIDIGQKCLTPLTETGPLYIGHFGKGKVIGLPFDLDKALLCTKATPKFFYYPSHKLPYETVALVSSGEIRKLVINCLRYLLLQQNLYYAHLWYYPNDYATIFSFRVDTDFSPWSQIQSVINLAESNQLSFTWFVNTKAQEDDLARFTKLAQQGQDVQLHCYQHNVFQDLLQNRTNIEQGKRLLQKVGITPIGFAGPFGEWNENLAQVLEALDFQYSSEFGLSYDDLPFFPIVQGRKSKVLEIPIHPICVGRLLQAGFDFNQIFIYFRRYVDQAFQMRTPIMIYDHPHRINQLWQLFDTLFKKVKAMKGVWFANFTQLLQWWQKRIRVNYNVTIEHDRLLIITNNENPDLTLHLLNPAGAETFLPLKNGEYHLSQLIWQAVPKSLLRIPYSELRKLRQAGIRLLLKEFVNTLNRKLKGQRR